MDFVRKVYKPWKPAKMHKKLKLGKCYKKIKPAKFFKILKPLYRMLFPAAAPLQGPREDNLAFMTCIIKVNASKPGWQKAVIHLLRNCKGARFKMDQSGVVEVSGIADPDLLLKKIGKSTRIELHWFQFGQCSSNLFMPETKKDPPAQQKPNYNNYNQAPNNNIYNLPMYRDYGYNRYQLPQVFKPYAPY